MSYIRACFPLKLKRAENIMDRLARRDFKGKGEVLLCETVDVITVRKYNYPRVPVSLSIAPVALFLRVDFQIGILHLAHPFSLLSAKKIVKSIW